VGMNTRIFVFDLVTKKIINRFDEENYVLSSAQVSPDGTLTAIGTFTGVINFYENTNFSKVLEIQTFIDKGPVWITSDNYYLSSKSSLKELYFKYNNTLYPFDQFDINFNRPDKVLEKLGKIEPVLLAAYKEAWNKRFRKSGIPSNRLRPDFKVPEVKILNAQDIPAFTTNDPVIRMALELSDGDADIVSYNIWVNGIPEYGTRWRKLKAIGKHVVINDSIRITGSNNIIQVGCKNSYGVESLREKFEVKNYVVDSIERKTYLYIVSVSNYSDARYNLKYAVKDGRDLAQAFKLRYKMNLIIDTLFNEKATLQNILAWRKELLKTNINDRVIIYVSGHGVLDKNFDFYYATSEIDFRDPSLKGLAYEDIEKLLDSIPAREKLLLMDACHSGEVDKETVVNGTAIRPPIKTDPAVVVYKSKGLIVEQGKKRLGLSNSFELMQDLFANLNSGNGTVVISAAAGNSYAYESDAWKNGVFTYSILHGLVDKVADMDNDKRVSLSEIQRYVSSQVQRLTKGAQKPTARQENLENDWIIW
ncbi:MAG: caspase family protein, partial [Chitinophagaceae bacterium]